MPRMKGNRFNGINRPSCASLAHGGSLCLQRLDRYGKIEASNGRSDFNNQHKKTDSPTACNSETILTSHVRYHVQGSFDYSNTFHSDKSLRVYSV